MTRSKAPLLLGLDTGGTFTDAVLMRCAGERGVGKPQLVAKAKARTTHENLATGIEQAISLVLEEAACDPHTIALVSLSTTLATNALVEGHGERAALVAIGFNPDDMARAGLPQTLGTDPVIYLPGGHRADGSEAQPVDMAMLDTALGDLHGLRGIAVAGLFATRNPAHEIAVRDYLAAKTGLSVTCTHELSARLNGPKRALTTLLNARLVPLIGHLLDAVGIVLANRGIAAPLMVVKGNGALVSAAVARQKPVETILSGPAASLVGAGFLTEERDVVVNDIGGTTSDIAILSNGKPAIDPDGATVGGHPTMVEAVALRTFALGGDSAIALRTQGLGMDIDLGPQRWLPVCALASRYGPIVHKVLDAQLAASRTTRRDATFAWRVNGPDTPLPTAEKRLLQRLTPNPQSLCALLASNAERPALERLVARGLARMAGPTPTDAQHVAGNQTQWDIQAATKAMELLARRKRGDGQAMEQGAAAMAARIVATVERRSAEAVLETAFIWQGEPAERVKNPLVARSLDRRAAQEGQEAGAELVLVPVTLSRPLVGLGASACLFHPQAARLLGTRAIVPNHADVANAIGAVVGQIIERSVVSVTQPEPLTFRVDGLENLFSDGQKAIARATELARESALHKASAAGAVECHVETQSNIRRATVEGQDMVVEAVITATASGRPPIA